VTPTTTMKRGLASKSVRGPWLLPTNYLVGTLLRVFCISWLTGTHSLWEASFLLRNAVLLDFGGTAIVRNPNLFG